MQLILILLITVAVLTFLSGAIVFFGSNKGERARSAWFFIAAIFATVWMASICCFMFANANWVSTQWHVKWTFASAIIIDTAFLGYITWKEKYGKYLTSFFLLAGLIIALFIFLRPEMLYKEVIFSNVGNSINLNLGILSLAYAGFFGLIVPAVAFSLWKQFTKSTSKKKRSGNITIMISFSLSSLIVLIVNLILPLLGNWNFTWLGPLALSVTIIAFYYTILRYRSLNLSSAWLKIFSYIVVASSLAIVYMIIFSIIFAALFRGSTPSIEVIILNFIMILIVILSQPATNEMGMYIRSLISHQQVDLAYIVKKLSRITPKKADLKDIAGFLAEHMHFEYIGFLIDHQLYSSSNNFKISPELIKEISEMGEPEDGIWQDFKGNPEIWKESNICAVAALRDGHGKTYGQLIIGNPKNKNKFARRDLVEIETIIDLTSVIIESKRNIQATKKG